MMQSTNRIAPLISSLAMICGLFAVVLLLAGCASTQPQERQVQADPVPTRPNILFIFSDDHAAQAISAYGSKINKTPNIDRLATEGMLFRNCFCTNSLCGPSRAVIQTGKHSHINGFRDNGQTFDGNQQTFPKLMQQGGYQMAMIGKWHLKSEPQGFDYWQVLPGQGRYYNPDFKTPDGEVHYTGYVTDITTDLALDWLKKQRDPNKPFMLMCQHKAPHRNWQPGPNHLRMYENETIPEPPTLFDDYTGRCSGAADQELSIANDIWLAWDLKIFPDHDIKKSEHPWGLNAWKRQRKRLNDQQRQMLDATFKARNDEYNTMEHSGPGFVRWKYQCYIKDYLRCIAGVDDSVGQLLDYLDQSGLADNTIVIYSSDQGFFLGEHGWFDKRWMYEESLRMPFLVRWPKAVKAGTVNEHLVQNLDFAETFLDLAGVEPPGDMQGRSIVPLLSGESPTDWRESIYYRYYEYPRPHRVPPHYGVRTDRYKLIYFNLTDEWELFDLKKDPNEMKSVYAEPAYADTVRKLKAELERLRTQYKDSDS